MTTPKPCIWELNYYQLLGEIGALREKLSRLETTVASLQSYDNNEGVEDEPRHSVKSTLLELLDEAGACGLSTPLALQKAARRGVRLDRGSVSSTLSKFKREGVAIYDGERYRLKRYEGHGLGGLHKASA